MIYSTVAQSVTDDEQIDINSYIFDILKQSSISSVVPFGSAFPEPRLFPLQQLNCSLVAVSKSTSPMSAIENLPLGNVALHHRIAQRYAHQGLPLTR